MDAFGGIAHSTVFNTGQSALTSLQAIMECNTPNCCCQKKQQCLAPLRSLGPSLELTRQFNSNSPQASTPPPHPPRPLPSCIWQYSHAATIGTYLKGCGCVVLEVEPCYAYLAGAVAPSLAEQ